MQVKVESKGNLNKIQKKIAKANLSKKLARRFSKKLKVAINENTSGYQTDALSGGIYTRKVGSEGYGVYSRQPYFWVVDQGRKAGSFVPYAHGKLPVWARRSRRWSYAGGAKALADNIYKYGTEGKFFYAKARKRMKPTQRKIIKRALK